jgi:hypothetical protein
MLAISFDFLEIPISLVGFQFHQVVRGGEHLSSDFIIVKKRSSYLPLTLKWGKEKDLI